LTGKVFQLLNVNFSLKIPLPKGGGIFYIRWRN